MEEFLSLRRLTVGYPDRTVLQNIDLQIAPGEILTVIGPNGAGKSTLLKSISGQLALLGGSVVMQGEDLQQCSAVDRARKMAVVLTEHIRPEYMTCREVVSAGRYPYTGRMGILQPRDKEITEQAMARMKVTELAERDFNAISDGQKQRVLVARAIAQDTPVLLLDEPTSYLDIRYRTELMEILQELAKEGRTILMSLHEIELALEVSDRILCVQEGQEACCGSPREILEQDRIRDLFGMSEEMYGKLFGEKKRQICAESGRSDTAGVSEDHTFFTNRSCRLRRKFPLYRQGRQGLHRMSCPPSPGELRHDHGEASGEKPGGIRCFCRNCGSALCRYFSGTDHRRDHRPVGGDLPASPP